MTTAGELFLHQNQDKAAAVLYVLCQPDGPDSHPFAQVVVLAAALANTAFILRPAASGTRINSRCRVYLVAPVKGDDKLSKGTYYIYSVGSVEYGHRYCAVECLTLARVPGINFLPQCMYLFQANARAGQVLT